MLEGSKFPFLLEDALSGRSPDSTESARLPDLSHLHRPSQEKSQSPADGDRQAEGSEELKRKATDVSDPDPKRRKIMPQKDQPRGSNAESYWELFFSISSCLKLLTDTGNTKETKCSIRSSSLRIEVNQASKVLGRALHACGQYLHDLPDVSMHEPYIIDALKSLEPFFKVWEQRSCKERITQASSVSRNDLAHFQANRFPGCILEELLGGFITIAPFDYAKKP